MANRKNEKERTVRVGVVGVQRGQSFAAGAFGTWEDRLCEVGMRYGTITYIDYGCFLEREMDDVIDAVKQLIDDAC